jgi:hypothetical protein
MPVLYLIPVWFVLALLIPIVWSVSNVRSWAAGRRVVICPETERATNIELNCRHAIAMHAFGNPGLRIQYCSRWPEHETCGRECLKQVPRPA